MKLISVIIPVYNIEDLLPRCLDSVLNQTYENLEIIVVDDGSTDASKDICDEYAKKDKRIKVIHQENAGLSGARNAALLIATGDYIGYVDGDDYIEPNMYQELIEACENNDAMMAACSYCQKGVGVEVWEHTSKVYVMSQEEALEAYVCENRSFHLYNSVWSKLFRRDLVDGVLFPLRRNSEDIVYTGRALANCNKCVFVDKPLYNYIMDREGSIMNASAKLAERRFNDEIPFWREQFSLFKEKGLLDIEKKAWYNFYKRMLAYYLDFRKRKMPNEAQRLSQMLLDEKSFIENIYANDFVKAGDRARMKLFLKSPKLYNDVVLLYDNIIVPVKEKRRAAFTVNHRD